MAVLSGQTYHKIDLNNLSIVNNKVVIRVNYYETKDDRDREKELETPINEFIVKANSFINDLQLEFNEILKKYEIDPNIEVNEEKFNEIMQNNEEIAEKYNQGVSYGLDFEMLVRCLKLKNLIDYSPNHLDKWKELGFDENWLIDSPSKLGSMELDLCEYTGQNLTPEFLYNTFKTKLENAVDC